MKQLTKSTFELDKYEYIIDGNHPIGRDYEVCLNGKKLNDVIALVRINIERCKKDGKK